MFPAQRISLLKNIVAEKKSVDIATLCSLLQVSDVTVRKYLDKLEQEGFLIKMHGGAMLAGEPCGIPTEEDTEPTPLSCFEEEKEQIAEMAAALVEDGDNLFLGCGTTCTILARHLSQKKNIRVLTNNLDALKYLAPHVKKLCILGGDVASCDGVMYSYGVNVIAQLERVYVSKAFFGAAGVDINAGVTVGDLELSRIMERICTQTAKKIILADSSKFDHIDLYQVSPLDGFDIFITDPKLNQTYKTYFFDRDIKLITNYDI